MLYPTKNRRKVGGLCIRHGTYQHDDGLLGLQTSNAITPPDLNIGFVHYCIQSSRHSSSRERKGRTTLPPTASRRFPQKSAANYSSAPADSSAKRTAPPPTEPGVVAAASRIGLLGSAKSAAADGGATDREALFINQLLLHLLARKQPGAASRQGCQFRNEVISRAAGLGRQEFMSQQALAA